MFSVGVSLLQLCKRVCIILFFFYQMHFSIFKVVEKEKEGLPSLLKGL